MIGTKTRGVMSVKDVEDFSLEMNCPICQNNKITINQKILDIPYFSSVWLFNLICPDCGFKHNDMINLELKEGIRYTYHAENKEDYTSKIVRSSNGTIRIPKIGVLLEPGPSSQGFIKNLEGILQDFKNKSLFLLKNAQSKEKRENIMNYIQLLDSYIKNNLPLDFIVEDPFGNSLIIPYNEKKLETKKLTKEEVRKLKTGFMIFEAEKNDLS